MFAYCNNNPVNCSDSFGNMCIPCTPYGGSAASYDIPGNNAIETDNNTNYTSAEQDVLNAQFVAIYKGAPVIKVPFMEDSAFSFGIIFMGPDVTTETLVQHEYGHVVHLW